MMIAERATVDARLRSYQRKAVLETQDHLRNGQSTLLVSPTGSGKTMMAAAIAEYYERVLVIAHRREIIDQARAIFGAHVQSCSVQSAVSVKGRKELPAEIDLLIIDEAHRAAAKTYRQIVAMYPRAVRLGLTATPLRTDGQGLCDSFAELVTCSSVRELIQDGFLVPYRALEAPDEALKQLPFMKKRAGDFAQRELADLMNKPRLVGDVVREYLKHGRGRKAVAFAVSIEHSIALKQAFKSAGVRADHIDGRASEGERKRALERIAKGSLDVLCNVNLFTEGWDCPAVSCIIMARPTASLTLYLQSVGRGMRPAKGKEDLLILDHAGNIERLGLPDEDRDWALESERQKAAREAAERERARLAALGFDSIEAELAERQRVHETTYSAREAAALLDVGQLSASFERFQIGPVPGGKGCQTRYPKEPVDRLVSIYRNTYTLKQCSELFGFRYGKLSSLNIFLKRQGIIPSVRGLYAKQEIDALVDELNSAYTVPQISSMLGFASPMQWLLRHHKISPRFRGAKGCESLYSKKAIDEIVSDFSASYSRREVNEKLSAYFKYPAGALLKRGIKSLDGTSHLGARYPKAEIDRLLDNLQSR